MVSPRLTDNASAPAPLECPNTSSDPPGATGTCRHRPDDAPGRQDQSRLGCSPQRGLRGDRRHRVHRPGPQLASARRDPRMSAFYGLFLPGIATTAAVTPNVGPTQIRTPDRPKPGPRSARAVRRLQTPLGFGTAPFARQCVYTPPTAAVICSSL